VLTGLQLGYWKGIRNLQAGAGDWKMAGVSWFDEETVEIIL
jgi:hypothetical protein